MLALSYGNANANAATCISGAGQGAVNVTVPELPTKGIYNVWSRVQVPNDIHNRYQLEVNGDTCFLVGGSSISPNQWTWVSFQDGDLSSKVKYNFVKTTGNSLKLIGNDAGVKIDRVLLVKNDCIPVEQGANCESDAVHTASYDKTGANILPTSTEGPASGVIIPSQTIIQNQNSIASVGYFVDGKPVPTAKDNGLDTTLLINGSHQISIKITKIGGTVIDEATTITTDNPQTFFSPLQRWARLNKGVAVATSIAMCVLIVFSFVLVLVRHIQLKKRSLTFHGF
jgi:hypothetical protein